MWRQHLICVAHQQKARGDFCADLWGGIHAAEMTLSRQGCGRFGTLEALETLAALEWNLRSNSTVFCAGLEMCILEKGP